MSDRANDIFRTAETYSKSAKYLNSIAHHDHSQLLPSQVIAALALELYFKALYYVENCEDFKVNRKHSHDFHKLFQSLTETSRNALILSFESQILARDMQDIEAIEAASGVSIPRDLTGNLEVWSNIFTQMRYIHDRAYAGTGRSMMFFPEIEKSARSVIIDLRPEFQS